MRIFRFGWWKGKRGYEVWWRVDKGRAGGRVCCGLGVIDSFGGEGVGARGMPGTGGETDM